MDRAVVLCNSAMRAIGQLFFRAVVPAAGLARRCGGCCDGADHGGGFTYRWNPDGRCVAGSL